MQLNAKQMESAQPVLEYGLIVNISQETFHVVTERGSFDSHLSFSCLVTPTVGDRVLLSVDETGLCYIISIIERPVTGNTQLNLTGDVNVRVHGGRLSMASDETISLATPVLEINASEGLIRMDKTSFLGRIVENQVEKLKLIADSVHSTIRRTVGRFTSSYRYIEENEEIQSASTRMIVDGTLTMHTKNTMHIAEGHVKIDAGQIHLG